MLKKYRYFSLFRIGRSTHFLHKSTSEKIYCDSNGYIYFVVKHNFSNQTSSMTPKIASVFRLPQTLPHSMKAQVLIVENEAISSLLLSRYMEKLGHEVVAIATTPKEALQLYYCHSPDVVVMDILLEAEINGIELAELFTYCPILFYSGVVDYELIKEAEKIPNSLFVSKPAHLEVIKHCLENLIEKASLGQ